MPVLASSHAKISTAATSISATSTATAGSVATQQITASLKVANAPPATVTGSQSANSQANVSNSNSSATSNSSSSVSAPKPLTVSSTVDLFLSVNNALNAIAAGTTPAPINLPNATIGGVLTITGVQITFAGIMVAGGAVTGGTVTVTATSASLSNLGTGVTSTIGTISGSYNIGSKTFSLTLHTISIAFSSFETVTAASANLTYNGSTGTTVTLTNGTSTSTKSVSLVTIGISNATVFAGINGPDTNANAVGVKLTGANMALALMSDSSGITYYGLKATAGVLTAVGLPTGFTLTSTDLAVDINGTSSGSNVVNFDTSFVAGTGLAVSTGSGSVNLDYTQQFLSASGTLELDFKGFIYIHGSMAITSVPTATVYVNNGTSTSTIATTAAELLIGANDVTIFAGMNGPASNASAVGLQLTGASLALALFKPTTGSDTYYGLKATATSLTGVGLPTGFTASATDISIQINGDKNATGSTVDFDSSFTSATSANGKGLDVKTSSSTSVNLDFTSAILSVAGTLELDFKGFIYIHGSMALTSMPTTTVYLNDGTTTSTTPTTVSELLIGANDVTIFAGMNGPASNASATGVEMDNAGFALALFKSTTSSATYYGLQTTVGTLSAVGLPSNMTIAANDLVVKINGSDNAGGNVVDFDASFTSTTSANGKGLDVKTSSSTSVNLDYVSSLVMAAATVTLDIGNYLHINGSFSFTKNSTEVDIEVGVTAFTGATALTLKLGSAANPYVTATGNLSMVINASSIIINHADLTVPGTFTIGSLLSVTTPSVSIDHFVIDRVTGALSGDGVNNPSIEITAGGATLFPGNSSITATISPTNPGGTGLDAKFDLTTHAFSIAVQKFELVVGTVLTADASNILITYNPEDSAPHQQLVQIGAGSIKFNQFNITGSVTNLVIYKDGFHFDSVTIAYTGTVTLGSILSLKDPSVTLTDFGVIFAGANTTATASGSLTLAVATATLNVGSAFTATATNLSITVALDSTHLGDTTITAGTVSLVFGSVVTVSATNISINTAPADGAAYLSVGSATATLNVGTVLSATGTATNFSLIKSGSSVQFHEDTGFSLTITVTPGQLNLPTWLGFQITKFEVKWTDFANHPDQFQLILSASINSISGLPGGVTVSGEITDAVIDTAKLEAGLFPITSIGSVGGSVSGKLFGMEVNASFVLGIVSFNASNQIVNADGTVTALTTHTDGSVTETTVAGGSTAIVDSVMFVGVSGGATIPGVGGVQIYIGFSSLGPLTVYLSAEFPLILDPDTGIAIGGFSGGVIFNYTIPTPSKPADLAGISLSPAGITISQWEQQLKDQTVSQYTASGGGTNLSAAYSQPFVIEAGVTLYDAYLTSNAFSITGNIAIQIDPSNASNVKIFVTGTATFGNTVSFNAFLYANIDASHPTPTVTFMFLFQEPASTPIETIGGALTFGFTDASGNALVPTAATPTTSTQTITLPDGTTHDFTQTTFTAPSQTVGGFYLSIDGFASFSAFGTLTATISGSVTLTVTTTFAKIDLSGDLNISALGDLATASGELVVDYSDGLSGLKIYGALKLATGAGVQKLQDVGLYVDGAITFVLNTTDSPQTVYLPDPLHPHITADATAFVINDTQSFEVTIGGTTSGTYASLAYKVSGHTLLDMQGDFDLKISASGLQMFADIHTLTVGPSGAPFLTLSGYGLFVINNQGFAAEMDLSLAAQAITGVTLNATFTLVMNTTSADVTYTIPSGLPALTIPGTSTTVTTLTIPRGPPQGLLQSDGTFASVGATGPYIVITGAGHLHLYSFDLQGFFYFQMSDSAAGAVVALVVSVSGDLGFGTVNITGGFQISSAGVVALLEASGSAGSTSNYGTGISLQVTAELAFNSTGSDVTSIGGIALTDTSGNPLTITAHSASVIASGTMTLTFGGASLVITGVFSTSVVDTGSGGTLVHTTTITVGGTLSATIGGSTLLTLNVSGVMVFKSGAGAGTDAGMAGELTATIGSANPLSGNGISFNGSFDVEINTTGVTQTVTVGAGTVSISAGPNNSSTGSAYAEVHAHGNLIFGTATNGFLLNSADFYLVAGTTGLAVSASATMVIEVGGTSLLSVSASGALFISSAGLAASLTVTTSFNDPSGNSYYAFNGTFVLQVNTTGVSQTIGSVTIPAAPNGSLNSSGGAYFQMHITGNLSLGTTNTNLASATGMVMHGEFYLTVTSAGLAISASTTLHLVVAGSDLFTFTANGALLITSSGIAAKISLTIGSGASGTGFTFGASMAFSLALNTTGSAVTVINNQTVNLPAGPYFQVKVSGNLTLAGVVTVQGSFTLTVNSTSVVINLNASLNLFGNVFTITGDAGIYSNGIAINLTLSLGTNTSPTVYLIPGVIAVSGNFNLQINTTGTAHFGVAGNVAFKVTVTNLAIYVFGFKMGSASFNITVLSNGVFSSSGTLTFDFFGFVTLNVTYNFDSTGQYYFHGSIYVQVGSDGFNIHGTLSLTFSNEPGQPSFVLDVNGGVTAFGISDIISADVNVTISGSSVDMSVYAGVSIDLGFYTIHIGGTVHIHLGTLNTPTPPPPPVISTVSTGSITVGGVTFGAGTLLLNIGSYAASDNRGVPAEADENYTISVKQVNGDGSVNLLVSAPGVYGQAIEYDNVRQIVVPQADASNVTVNIAGAVTLPVTIFAGSGVNQFFLGGGTATIHGTNGNDTVFGGTGNVNFTAGSGTSTFQGGGTGSTHNVITDPGNVTVVENGYSSYSLIGTSATSATLNYGGNTDVLNGVDIAVALTGAVSGHQTFAVANYFGAGVTLDSASNTDVATTITLDTGNLAVDGNIVTASNGTDGTVTLNGINTATLNGGSAANVFTVNSWSGTGVLTLDGKGGDDIYNINFQSSGSFTATVSDSGSAGNDSVIINGTTGNDTIKITGSAVTLGTQTVNYSGVENLTVYTKTGNDTVDLAGASIPTNINTGNGTNTINLGTNAFTTNSSGTLNNFTALVTITGGGTETVNLDDAGDISANTGTLSATSLTGVFGSGGSLSFSSIENFNLNLGSGGNTLTITDGSGTMHINSGSGSDTVNIQGMNGTMVVNTGIGTNSVNIGSTMPTVGGVLTNIKGALTITGGGTTTLNVDDTGDVVAVSGMLTGSTITGLGMGASGIIYSAVNTLNISLGSGGNTFTISNTNGSTATTLNSGSAADTVNLTTDSSATTINGQGGNDIINVTNDGALTTINGGDGNDTVNIVADHATTNIYGQNNNDTINIKSTNAATNVDTGSGTNTINIGSLAPAASGIVDNIQGAVVITGSSNDTLNVDDTGSSSGKTGKLTSTTLTGLGMIAAGITYSGVATLNISLGSGGDTFNVWSTYSGAVSTVNTGTGTNTVNVTSNAPSTSGGILTGIAGKLIVNGQGTDTMNVNDTGDAASGTLTQTATTLNGLGMGASGVEYHSVETLNVKLGSHNNTIYIQGNASVTTENLTTGSGTNVIDIGTNAGPIGAVDPITGNAPNTGSVLAYVQGIINITGSGTDTMNVDDSGSTVGENGGMWSNKLQFLDPVTINFTGIVAIGISFGSGNDQFVIADTITSASATPVIIIDGNAGDDTFVNFDTHAVTTINGGDNDDSFYDFGNSAVLNLNGDAGDDTFYVYASVSENTTNVGPGAADSNGNQVYSYRVNAPVNIDGGTGNDKLFIFATVLNDVITITSTSVTGAGLSVNYTNIEQLIIAGLGGDDTFYIESISIPTTVIGDGAIVLPSVAALLTALGLSLPNLNGNAPPATSFNDTFYVGWQGANYIPGSLAGIQAPLTIYGDNGQNLDGSTTNTPGTTDTIYVDDSGDTFNRHFTLTATTLTSDSMGAQGLINYDGAVDNLNIHGGAGQNTYTINGNGTAFQTSIYGGSGNDTFIVNDDPLLAPLAIFGESNTFPGDTLIVNGEAQVGNDFNITGFTIDGAGATISYQTIEKLIINAGGATNFTVDGDSVPTYLNGGNAVDTFTINSSSVPLFLDGGASADTFTINGNSGPLTATGDAGNDIFTVNGNGGSIALSGGDDNDTFTINGNSGSSLVVNGNAGNDSFTVNALGSPSTLNGGAGDDSFTVNAPIAASLTVNGGGDANDTLTVNGTTANDYITVTGNTVDGAGSTIHYNTVSYLVVNVLAGDDTILLLSDSVNTTLNGGTGNNTFYIRTTNAATFVNTGTGINLVDIGSYQPYPASSILDGIQGAVTVTGNNHDTLNIDDTASVTGKVGTLTSTTLNGLAMGAGGITYTGILNLNLLLGLGSDTLNIQSTNATTKTIVNTGTGSNIINVGSLEPVLGGIVDNIQGILTLIGSGTDTLNVDDTGSTIGKMGTLTSTTLTGLSMGASGIIYSGLSVLNISLGSGGDTFLIVSTPTAVTTVNGNDGADTFNVQSNTGALNLNGGLGNDTFNFGSLMPTTGGTVNNLVGQVTVNGGGDSDTVNVDDTADTTSNTGTVTATSLTGLGMGNGINYSSVEALNISLGSGGNTFTVSSTNAATTTTLNSGSAADTINLLADSGLTYINAQGGNDTINIQSTSAVTNVNTGAGTNTVNVGSLAPTTGGIVDNIQGALIIVGSGSDTLNIDDTGSAGSKTGTLTATTLTGLAMGASGITYSGLAALNISLGSGGNIFNINNTYSATATTLNSGSGADTVNLYADAGVTNINTQAANDVINIQSTNGTTTVNTGLGANTINVGSLAPTLSGGIVDNIQGQLIIQGSGSDTLNVDDTGSEGDKTGTLTSTTLTGLAMGAAGIIYSGLSVLNISLGSGDDTFTINSVTPTTSMTVDAGAGTDTAILSFNSSVNIESLTLLNFEDTTLYVNGDFTGLLNDSGPISEATITGSLTSGSEIDASAIGTMTIGGDLAGLLNVSGLLDTLTVDGGTPGKIIAGDINVITVLAGYGNKVLQVIEGGIERQIQATPVGGGNLPGTIHFAFVYDSESAADPQLAIRITNTAPVARSFNLVLAVINSSTAKFNLSRVDAYLGGKTGVSNIALQGDLLISLTIPELQLFTDLTTTSLGGVVLPADSITGVEVSGRLPIGFINVAGIEGLAFSVLTTALGVPVALLGSLGSATNPQVLWNLLGSKAALNFATDAFVIPFNETGSVKLYAHDKTSLDLQLVATFADQLNDNAPITAYVQIVPSLAKKSNPLISNLAFVGAGAAVNSLVSIANLTSTGSLGNLTVGGTAGLGNVTATSVFGNINVTSGGIYGIIQTTDGDLGSVTFGTGDAITGVTTIFAQGAITGQIISRGNLISSVKTNGAFSGVIAAQGDIGLILHDGSGQPVTNAAGALVRFGSISIKGNDSGKIIALGNLLGDVAIGGTMTGRIAVAGQVINGLAANRFGIMGSVSIKSFAAGAAIVSGGLLGDIAGKTTVSLGSAKGFLAVHGGINLASTTKIATANVFKNLNTGANLSALNAIFTDASNLLTFDAGGNLAGLGLIETDLAGLHISGGSLTGTNP